MVRRRVVVSGRVQGVFFRVTCRREALLAGVHGWVRNNPDGTLEAVFEGPEDAVRRMVEWCRRGPSHAHVGNVEVYVEEPRNETAFRIVG